VRRLPRPVFSVLLVACAAAGFAAAIAFGAATAGADTGTTSTTATTTTPPETQPPLSQPPPHLPKLIAPGVTVGSIDVGGLSRSRATELVRSSFVRPVVLVVSATRRVRLAPREVGARANVAKAIRRALSAHSFARLPLDIHVSTRRVRRYVERLGVELDRDPVNAHMVLQRLTPVLKKEVVGRRLKRRVTTRELRQALATGARAPIQVAFQVLRPKVREGFFGPAIVIERGSNKLLLYHRSALVRTFPVATGQTAYPTPLGEFEIVVKERNPWWYPPPSPWAVGESPVPPGPGNPLGTRWMGLSAPDVGIHGTPDAASVGYSVSHGCIRMHIPDAEWLFVRVKVGTPVFIVPN
jgi:hypothetical protein